MDPGRADDGSPLHFGDPALELQAALASCALLDRSSFGRLLGDGPDLLDLLQRLSTGDLSSLAGGGGRPTVLTTAKGRIVERLFVHHLGDDGLLLGSGPGGGAAVLAHLARYTFAEKTGLSEITGETCQLALVGPQAAEALSVVAAAPERHATAVATFEDAPLWVLGQDGLSGDGYSVVAPLALREALWTRLTQAVGDLGGRPAGWQAAEAQRLLRGIPAPGRELTEERNPLEAGLDEAVSFDKGCYVGQEVVARLHTYDKVSRKLVGLRLPDGAPLPGKGTDLVQEGRRIGEITSAVSLPGTDRPIALGFIKKRAWTPGSGLEIGAAQAALTAEVVDLPFPEADE